jgi:hypothetical protein
MREKSDESGGINVSEEKEPKETTNPESESVEGKSLEKEAVEKAPDTPAASNEVDEETVSIEALGSLVRKAMTKTDYTGIAKQIELEKKKIANIFSQPAIKVKRDMREIVKNASRAGTFTLNEDIFLNVIYPKFNSPIVDYYKNALNFEDIVAEILGNTKFKFDVDWENIETHLTTTFHDAKIDKYENSPNFHKNLNEMSMELLTLPFTPPDSVLNLLKADNLDMEQLKLELGLSDTASLKEEMENTEHTGYKFKTYIEEVLKNHDENPERYRLLIPAYLLTIEGTLSEIFRISEKGMASEIKQKMNLFWDLLQSAYTGKEFDKSDSFYTQILLSNVKTVFGELTSSSNSSSKEGVKLNRNLVLHGRSNPEEWVEEDLFRLSQLLNTTLYMRRTLTILMDEFTEIIEEADTQITLDEYGKTLTKKIAGIERTKKKNMTVQHTEQKIRAELTSDLKHIFGDKSDVIDGIIQKCNIQQVARDAYHLHIAKLKKKAKQ